ncbi:hypothetical protein [Sphingomonas sp. MMS24-J13]|uniref:hypothetical protein n=1 Tax=Sphingomonas sp. MMS24-J13 TaxID=3238686 RepID=UPI00384B9804
MAVFAYCVRGAALIGLTLGALSPANAYLYWGKLPLAGAPVTGDDPRIAISLAGATAKELQANLTWTMRAGLNVAALQCQFAPALGTVANYNNMLRQHAAELQATYATLGAYFKRTLPKNWSIAFDQYTTRTYNSFSTLQAQRSFCEVASSIGQDTLARPKGQLGAVAIARLREFRNSLTPIGDSGFVGVRPDVDVKIDALPPLEPVCYDKKGREKPCKKRG